MKKKFEKNTTTQGTEAGAYIDYITLNQTVILFKNWIKYKNTLIDKPCDQKASTFYGIAKLINNENPLPLLMPEVHFDPGYNSAAGESWKELYLKDDIFIARENLHGNRFSAFSLETVFFANKFNGFLRTNLRYDDIQRTLMSPRDQERFLAQLKERYPAYYQDYLEAQPESSLMEISKEKLNLLLNTVEVMLLLSCHKGGLRNTTLPNSVSDFLSAYGYDLLMNVISEQLSVKEQEGLKQLWAKNIHNSSEKTVRDLLDSALDGACTTTLGLYWLGLIKEFRQGFALKADKLFLSNLYGHFVTNNPLESRISKKFFMECLNENMQYIVREMLEPQEEFVSTHGY